MRFFLSKDSALKWLETPSVYNIKKDELYELDNEAFEFLERCQSKNGCAVKSNEFIDYCLNENILTTTHISINRPPLIKSSKPSLKYLELQITDKCNLRCRHCYIGDDIALPYITSPMSPDHQGRGKQGETSIQKFPLPLWERVRVRGNELSVSQIEKILTEFEEMQGLRVLITGGEPLLHNKFKEINRMFPKFFLRKILFTNGLLLNKEILKNLNVDEIQISIDGLEKAHDSLRGKGTFKKAIKAIELAAASGFEVSVSTMIHSKNLKDFNKMEKLFKRIGIKDWTVDVPCSTGRLKENIEFQTTPSQGGQYLKYGYGEGMHAGAPGFGCGLHLMSVMADGRIAKCSFYSHRAVGTVKDGLKKCWEKIKPVKLNELNCDCRYIEQCRGGCRYRAEVLGNPLGKDLYRCFLYGIIESKNKA